MPHRRAVVAHVALHHEFDAALFILGTPNGQASTQLLQAMQRGLRAVCTTPSAVRLMASAGQTSAQVGESQCMQTTGTVCVRHVAVDIVELDHRLSLVRVALAARLHARLAADAAAGVDEELLGACQHSRSSGSVFARLLLGAQTAACRAVPPLRVRLPRAWPCARARHRPCTRESSKWGPARQS